MARFDPETVLDAHRLIGQACATWMPKATPNTAKAYLERHGIAHLLVAAEHTIARGRMADIEFMAAFADAWDTLVQPLAAWRAVGMESVEAALLANAAKRPHFDVNDSAAMATVAEFLESAGCWVAAHTLAVQVERATPIDDREATVRAMLRVAAARGGAGGARGGARGGAGDVGRSRPRNDVAAGLGNPENSLIRAAKSGDGLPASACANETPSGQRLPHC